MIFHFCQKVCCTQIEIRQNFSCYWKVSLIFNVDLCKRPLFLKRIVRTQLDNSYTWRSVTTKYIVDYDGELKEIQSDNHYMKTEVMMINAGYVFC